MATLPPSLSSEDEGVTSDQEESEDEDELDKSFQFGGVLGEDGGISEAIDGWSYQTALASLGDKPSVPRLDVTALISAKRKTLGAKSKQPTVVVSEENKSDSSDSSKSSDSDSDSSSDSSSEEEGDVEAVGDHENLEADVLKTRTGKQSSVEDAEEKEVDTHKDVGDNAQDDQPVDEEEATKAANFFDNADGLQTLERAEVFNQLNLSRPLLRGVAAMGFVKPTPVQAKVIPLALAGRDICASAVTGSGKTAAFVLPLLERLLHLKHANQTRAVILTPTRELAAQCVGMLTGMAQFTGIRSTLIVGGSKNIQSQAAELRKRPDIVVATPGRLLDHITNTSGFSLHAIDFLILDEADRLLDLGFQDELQEIIKSCPTARRQTLLFSATMNTRVDDLIALSLKRPLRVHVSDKNQKNASQSVEVAPRLEQEFVRIRAGNEGVNREGILLALLTRTFQKQTIVFFDTKATAHRLMILCGLCGIKCTELHGNLTQQQRLAALDEFSSSQVDVLFATDLAARGLDMDRVATVINFEMPTQVETYVHRIGRTARAGRQGRSCTLIGEGRRHLMKELIKDAESKRVKEGKTKQDGMIRTRTIPAPVVAHFVEKIKSLSTHVEEIMQAEAVARLDRIAEMEAIRAQNLLEHSNEIKARPAREWFASKQQKENTRQKAKERALQAAEKAGSGTHRMNRKKRRAREALDALDQQDDSFDDEAGPPSAKVNTKLMARKEKRRQTQQEEHKFSQSINDSILEREHKRKMKVKDSAGDSSIFKEEKVTYAPKNDQKETVIKSAYSFRGYDPERKLGKRKGNKRFKSKSKYRRR